MINDFPSQSKGILFKKETLVEELLSLGHSKITPEVAQSIGDSVESEILRRQIQFLSQELISELVECKLSEMGLIKLRKAEPVSAAVSFSPVTFPLLDRPVPDQSEPKLDLAVAKDLSPAILNVLTSEKKSVQPVEDSNFKEPVLSAKAGALMASEYLSQNAQGEVSETPSQFFKRLSKLVASAEIKYAPTSSVTQLEAEFYRLMAGGIFLPSHEILKNAGRTGLLSSGHAIPISDSMESIFEAMKQVAIVQKNGGGTSLNFSRLRPMHDSVQTHSGYSSGPVSFIGVYESTCRAVRKGKQGFSKSRCVLNVQHPDILDFLNLLHDSPDSALSLTVMLTEPFMQALEKKGMVELINPRTGACVKSVSAHHILEKIFLNVQRFGQPQLVFAERLVTNNPTPLLGLLENLDPSGFQSVLPYEAVHYGAVNLSYFVTSDKKIDWENLAKTVETAIHFLENSFEVASHALPEAEELTRKNRKIALSVMGWADMLIKIGIPYQSSLAETLAGQLMSFISNEAQLTSIALAKKRGPFAHFGSSHFADQGLRRRHAHLTAVLPHENMATLASCTAGIQPLSRLTEGLEEDAVLTPLLDQHVQVADKSVWIEYLKTQPSLQGFSLAPQNIKDLFVTSEELDFEAHLKCQSAFQKHVEGSATCIMPTVLAKNTDMAARLIILANQLGLQQISWKEPLQVKVATPEISEKMNLSCLTEDRPEVLAGITRRFQTACGDLTVTLNEGVQGLTEVFTRLDQAGLCATAQMEALTRLVDLALKSGISPKAIGDRLAGIPCSEHRTDNLQAISYADALGRALSEKNTK